jgi:hypothetical protein
MFSFQKKKKKTTISFKTKISSKPIRKKYPQIYLIKIVLSVYKYSKYTLNLV